MNRRRLALIAGGMALTAGATVGASASQADTAPIEPIVSLRADSVACGGVVAVGVAVCVENPATIIDGLPRPGQTVQDLTGG